MHSRPSPHCFLPSFEHPCRDETRAYTRRIATEAKTVDRCGCAEQEPLRSKVLPTGERCRGVPAAQPSQPKGRSPVPPAARA